MSQKGSKKHKVPSKDFNEKSETKLVDYELSDFKNPREYNEKKK